MKRIIIAGGRDFNNMEILRNALEVNTTGLMANTLQIVSGGARGADSLGERLAREHRTNLAVFPAQWEQHGKSAGYIRNELMAQNADMLIAFWDGQSRGTEHMINLARKYQLEVHIVNYKQE